MGFIVENFVDSYWTMSRKEFAFIWILLFIFEMTSLIIAVLLAVLLAAVVFAVQYARRPPIQAVLTGMDCFTQERSPKLESKLAQLGKVSVVVLKLRGYIFFGTASHIEEAIRLAAQQRQKIGVCLMKYAVLDFSEIMGIDASSMTVFDGMIRKAKRGTYKILWVGLSEKLETKLKAENIIQPGSVFLTLGRAMEFVEEGLLEFSDSCRRKWLVTPPLKYIYAVHKVRNAAEGDGAWNGSAFANFHRVTYASEEIVCNAGDISDSMALVLRGRLDAYEKDSKIPHHTVFAGALINEECVWLDASAPYTIIATHKTVLMSISKSELQNADSKTVALLQDQIIRRMLRSRWRGKKIEFDSLEAVTMNNATALTNSFSLRATSSFRVGSGSSVLSAPEGSIYPELAKEEIERLTELYHNCFLARDTEDSVEIQNIKKAVAIISRFQKVNDVPTEEEEEEEIKVDLDTFLSIVQKSFMGPLSPRLLASITELCGKHEPITAEDVLGTLHGAGHAVSKSSVRLEYQEVPSFSMGKAARYHSLCLMCAKILQRDWIRLRLQEAFVLFAPDGCRTVGLEVLKSMLHEKHIPPEVAVEMMYEADTEGTFWLPASQETHFEDGIMPDEGTSSPTLLNININDEVPTAEITFEMFAQAVTCN